LALHPTWHFPDRYCNPNAERDGVFPRTLDFGS